jgi:xanthine dehydrogenase YagS FAD-binding subunit
VIRFVSTVPDAAAAEGEFRAGGTDLTERRKSGRTDGPVVDLRDVPGLDRIEDLDGGLRIGAKVSIQALGADPRTPAGLAAAANGLATPQIRHVATIGGNISQRVRCWYFRNPEFACLQSGGHSCLAREGDHLYHACFDTGGCIAPHASTLACALLAHEAMVEVAGQEAPIRLHEALDALVAHAFGTGPRILITAVRVPAAFPGEKAAYLRAIARSRAEWPLVEVVARLSVEGGVITAARVAVGGVATVPLRRPAVEAKLVGQPPTDETFAAASALAADGARALPMTGYKLPLLVGTVREALERAAKGA